MQQLKECEAGTEVVIRAVVVSQQAGQTLVHLAGLGGSGLWSLPNSTAGEVAGTITKAQRAALSALVERAGVDA